MKHALPPELIFKTARLLQSELGAWRDCPHLACRNTQRCIGGPRGTRLKTGGWPLCTEEGKGRADVARAKKTWPGEKVPEDETVSERRMRRLNDMLTRLALQAKLDSIQPQKPKKEPPENHTLSPPAW